MEYIDSFSGEYGWLSNFYLTEIEMDGKIYPSVEHAYQAAKTLNESEREFIRNLSSPGNAKRQGKKLTLRSDWKKIKVDIMHDLVYKKFSTNSILRTMLLNTGTKHLIEGNDWGDKFWGMVDGEGQNHLGKILMQVRYELLLDEFITY